MSEKSLQNVTDLFTELQVRIGELAVYANDKRFPPCDLVNATIALLRNLDEKAETVNAIQGVCEDFLRLHSDDAKYAKELERHQDKIKALTHAQMSHLIFDRDVQPYQEFCQLVKEFDPVANKNQIARLAMYFGDSLALGLVLHAIQEKPVDCILGAEQTVIVESSDETVVELEQGDEKPALVEDRDELNDVAINGVKNNAHKSAKGMYDSAELSPPPTPAITALLSHDFFHKIIGDITTPSVVRPGEISFSRALTRNNRRVRENAILMVEPRVGPTKSVKGGKDAADKPAPKHEAVRQLSVDEATSSHDELAHSVECPAPTDQVAAINEAVSASQSDLNAVRDTELKIKPDMTARQLACHFLERGVTPDNTAAFQILLERILSEGKVITDIEKPEHSLAQALVLSKALSIYSSDYEELYRRLVMASDSPLGERLYDGHTIISLFCANGEQQGASLHLASLLRALFAPDSPYDYLLATHAKEVFSDFEIRFGRFQLLKPLYNLFLRINALSTDGFSIAILRKFGNKQTEQKTIGQIKKEAEKLRGDVFSKQSAQVLSSVKTQCFGRGSDFYRCMDIIAGDKRSERGSVELVLSEYRAATDSSGKSVSQMKPEQQFESYISKAIGEQRVLFESSAVPKSNIANGFNERLSLMSRWLDATANVTEDVQKSKELQSLRADILSEIERILPELAAGLLSAERTTFVSVLENLRSKLNGQTAEEHLSFVEFLRTGIFRIDSSTLPIIDHTFASIKHYEPWRNVLRHLATPAIGFRAILASVGDVKTPYIFDNIAQAIAICRLLNEHCGAKLDTAQYEQDLPRAKQAALRAIEEFKAEMELAFGYGRISETLKEDVLNISGHFAEIFLDRGDFGALRQFLQALRTTVGEATTERYAELERDIAERKIAAKSEELKAILDAAMATMQPPYQNFVVAEEYINRFDVGISDEFDTKHFDRESAFLRFIAEDTYDRLYELCRKNKSNSLRNFGPEYIESELKKRGISTQYQISGRELLLRMPNRPTEVQQANARNLLCDIGLVATAVKVVTTSTAVRLQVEVTPDPKDKAEYMHPVDIMGTKLKSPVDVVFLFGGLQANDIVDRICAFEINNTAIVFLNGALDLHARRQISEQFHRNKSGQNPFLLVDWVLLLHLAMLQKSERLSVFLACSLPYTSSFQPFVLTGSVSDEMFIGRKSELTQILDPKGPVIVYGGRQLGKTALLERALSRANHPDKKEFAILVRGGSIAKTEEALTKAISNELRIGGLGVSTALNLSDLCKELRKKHNARAWKKILLLIDEADAFLEEFRKTNPPYKAIIALSDLKRQTSNDFKFVLAGLHNVCRAATDPNTIFGQLGKALPIKPLSQADALELLSRPLRYMGFRIAPGNLEHLLVNTSFYPGIVQYVGYSIVQNLATRYKDYYQAARGHPPYDLTDKQIGDIMSNDALNEQINVRIRWTLDVDPRYFMLARCIAHLYLDYPEDNNRGYLIEQILAYADVLKIAILKDMSSRDCAALLLELVEMGILVQPTADTFRLRQRRFLDAIGNTPEKIKAEIEIAESKTSYA